tara:strand:- start:975 stop:1571 length:597 start_codon:yes stop_codon:yes gene_type:complete
MIVHGWKNLGERTLGTSATTVNEISTVVDAEGFVDTDGFSYCLVGIGSVSGQSNCEVWGTWFNGESSQTQTTVINCKIGEIQTTADATITVPSGTLGCSVDTNWSRIDDWVDAGSISDAEVMGLLCRVSGYAGPEMAQTGTAAATFGSFASDSYIAHKGTANGPGFVVVPCGMFSGLQFAHYRSGGAELGSIFTCLIQ